MIKFFRKIRQRMLSESKFSKYLLYAIGEIVLVMIGILMALQINTWNEQRKMQNTNQVLLNKLVGELDLNVDRMTYLDSLALQDGIPMGLNTFSLRIDTALLYINQGLDSTKIEWLLSQQLFYGSTLNLHTSVYEEMKNTGRLYSLSSDSLLHKINNYYRLLEREEFYIDKFNSRAINRWTECKHGYQLFKIDYWNQGISALEDHPWLLNPSTKEYKNLKIALDESARTTGTSRYRMKRIIQDSKALKAELTALLKSENP